MEYPKPGQVWINMGFEAAYRTKFYNSVIRILKVEGDVITVRSLADTAFGVFAYGGPMGEPFQLYLTPKENDRFTFQQRFRPYRTGDLDKFIKHRYVNRVLFGPANK